MARIVGGIGSSHAPSMAHAYDHQWSDKPEWKPLFEGSVPARRWLLEAAKPDAIVIFYNDHLNRFFFDAYPTFAIGVSETLPLADEGWGKRALPDFKGHPDLAWHITRSLMAEEFDLTVCQEMEIDHGILSPLPFLTEPEKRGWPCPIIPFAINVIQHPLPTARRCWKLGQALRRAVQSYPQDLRVVVVGTGGMSHQLNGKRFGFLNPEWDNEFLDLLETRPDALAALSAEDYMARGGCESVELIIWLAMRGALSPEVRRIHRNYYAPMLTGYGLLALEEKQ
jgi:protocatechuate 4,5-dioxygenase, beta chain